MEIFLESSLLVVIDLLDEKGLLQQSGLLLKIRLHLQVDLLLHT